MSSLRPAGTDRADVEFARNIERYVEGQIGKRTRLHVFTVDVPAVMPSAFDIRIASEWIVGGVCAAGIRNLTSPATLVTTAAEPHWERTTDGITVRWICGLAVSTKYELRLLLVEE